MNVRLAARKVSTGETRVVELGPHHPLIRRIGSINDADHLAHYMDFELGQNNWSCDCNRCSFFGDDYPEDCEEKEYAVEWFEINGRKFSAEDNYGRKFSRLDWEDLES